LRAAEAYEMLENYENALENYKIYIEKEKNEEEVQKV
jgi:hypothetical protein